MLTQILVPFIKYKYLLSQLVIREIKARYKQSIIGYAWVIINPLSQLLVYTFVFSIIFKFPPQNVPYPLFLFAGLLPWLYLNTVLTTSTLSLVDNSNLIKKVYFPREVLPYSIVFSKLVDLFFACLIMLIFIFAYQIQLSPQAILTIPILAIQMLLITGLSLIFATGNLFYRDVQFLISLILLLWLYLTPVVYPTSLVPENYLWLYKLNPMVGIIEGYRSALFSTSLAWNDLLYSTITSFLIFLLGYVLFKKGEKFFADIV